MSDLTRFVPGCLCLIGLEYLLFGLVWVRRPFVQEGPFCQELMEWELELVCKY